MPEDDPSKNPFVRWKHHVDSSIGSTLNGLLGLPSIVSKNFGLRRPDDADRCSCGRDSVPEGTAPDPNLEQMVAFNDFLVTSPYSPLHLQHLSQPVPRDAPRGVDPNGFTFSDALEDLLAVSSGRPLMDLASRYRLNKGIRQLDLESPEYMMWDWWYRRLQGGRKSYLLDAYFPAGPSWRDEENKYSREESHENEQTASRGNGETEQNPASDSSYESSPGGMLDDLDRYLKLLRRVIDDEAEVSRESHKEREDSNARQEPAVEDELYSTVRSAFAESGRSLAQFVKSIADVKFSGGVQTSVSTSRSIQSRVGEPAERDRRTERTTEEYTDIFGNHHIKTVIRTLDENGDEVARQSNHTIQSSSRSAADETDGGEDEYDDDGRPQQQTRREEKEDKMDGDRNEQKKSGWFWK